MVLLGVLRGSLPEELLEVLQVEVLEVLLVEGLGALPEVLLPESLEVLGEVQEQVQDRWPRSSSFPSVA